MWHEGKLRYHRPKKHKREDLMKTCIFRALFRFWSFHLLCNEIVWKTKGHFLSASLFPSTFILTVLFCFQPSLYYRAAHTHIPQLNSTTVVVRSSPGPLISPRLLCLLSRPALHAESVFNMAAHRGFQSNNKLYLQLSAGLNHRDYWSTKCWNPVNITALKKVNRPKEINIARPSTEISFGVRNLIFITCKYGAEVKKVERLNLQFQWMWTITMEFFFLFFPSFFSTVSFLPQMYNRSFSKSLQQGCYLLSREEP